MNKNSNFHSHCTFRDGRSPAEEFVKAAIKANFRAYGFSSHSPLPFDTSWNMNINNMEAYLEEIKRLKIKYKNDIELYTGLEIDYLNESYNAGIKYFKDLPLDFRISSIHFIPLQLPLCEENMMCIDGPYTDFAETLNSHYEGSISFLTGLFFHYSMKMIETGCFDIVGHIDKISFNGSLHPDFDLDAVWFKRPFLELLDFVAEKDYIVEINTKYMKKRGQTFPSIQSFKELFIRKIRVMVNSDCHYPELVNDGREETLELLKNVGFKCVHEMVGGKWDEVGL